MSESTTPYDVMIERLGVLANQSLGLWDLPEGATARLINVSENATYLVEAPNGFKSILRVHREDYHTRNAISCEHAWSKALDEEGGVHTPDILPGRDGSGIQTASVDGLAGERHMAMFEFLEGEHPEEDADHLVESFEERAYWGDWRDAPGVTEQIKTLLERLQSVVVRRLTEFGKGAERFGLIHADMRLANLIISDGTTRLIDFDDCGLGWFMYDFAAGISFMEDHPQIPNLKGAWVRGYRKVRGLSAADEDEIDTFVMLRRLALLAWIGSHIEVDTAKELAPAFAPVTAALAEIFLSHQE